MLWHSVQRHHLIFLYWKQKNSLSVSLTHTDVHTHAYSFLLSPSHTDACAVPWRASSAAVLSPVRADTSKEGQSQACSTVTKLFWRTPHPTVQINSVHCSAMWTNGTRAMKICDLQESQCHFLRIIVSWCSAWPITWLMDHLVFVR